MRKTIFVLILLAFSSLAIAEEIKLNSFVDKAKASTDEMIRFKITLSYPEGEEINIPEVGHLIQGLSVKEFGKNTPEIIKGVVLKERWYDLEASISGTYRLPPVVIQYKEKEYKTLPIFAEFTMSEEEKKRGKEQDIRDIKDIYKVPFNTLILIIIVAILILVVIGVFIYIKFFKNAYKKIITKPPHEIAYKKLEILKKNPFDNRENTKLFSFSISEIIRTYIEDIFGLNVTDKTTYEIKKEINSIADFNLEDRNNFLKILDDTDLIKFTDIVPPVTKKEELLNITKEIIDRTCKKSETEEEEEIL